MEQHAGTKRDLRAELRQQLTRTSLQLTSAGGLKQCDTWAWAPDSSALRQATAKLHLSQPPIGSTAASHTQRSTCEHSVDEASQSTVTLQQALAQSRSYSSPYCATTLLDALGLIAAYEGGGTSAAALPHVPSDGEALEALRSAFKQHVNAAWATEAVKQGVALANTGSYEEARRCYGKALELEPDNVDALVARGAALANERNYLAAAADLRAALALAPDNRNANRYLRAVRERAAEADIDIDSSSKPLAQTTPLPTSSPLDPTTLQHALQAADHVNDNCNRATDAVARCRGSLAPSRQDPSVNLGTTRNEHKKRRRSKSPSIDVSNATTSDAASSSYTSSEDTRRVQREAHEGKSKQLSTAPTLRAALQAVLSARKDKKRRKTKSKSKKRHKKRKEKKKQ